MGAILVTNRNAETLRDRYDGVDYVFAPNETVAIPEEAARHIFGYGDPDIRRVLLRQGWMKSTTEERAALTRLGNFKIEAATMRFEPARAEPAAESEARPKVKLFDQKKADANHPRNVSDAGSAPSA